jgi:hypothetical protein
MFYRNPILRGLDKTALETQASFNCNMVNGGTNGKEKVEPGPGYPEKNKKTPPRQKEALCNQRPSFLLLSNLGSNAVSSGTVDPSIEGYRLFTLSRFFRGLGRTAPEI